MEKVKRIILLLAVFLCLTLGQAAFAENTAQYKDDSIIVITKPAASYSLFSVGSGYDAVLARLGITEKETVVQLTSDIYGTPTLFTRTAASYGEIQKLTLGEAGEENVQNAIDELKKSGAVAEAQPNYIYSLMASVNDPYYGNQTNLLNVLAADVWDYDIDCQNVTIAIIDSGLMIGHEDIEDNVWVNTGEFADDGIDNDGNGYIDDVHGWDFTVDGSQTQNTDPTNPIDPYFSNRVGEDGYIQGHGTHVAATASGVTNNNKGVASIARNAKLVGLRAYDDEKQSTSALVCEAINYAGKMEFDIVNCSWGMLGSMDTALRTVILKYPNLLFVCAAGNGVEVGNTVEGTNNDTIPVYPASLCLPNTISVAASNGNMLASFSNYGETVEIAAPGIGVWSASNTNLSGNEYKRLSGTSQSAPLVASAAAALKGRYPNLTASELKNYILKGSRIVEGLNYTDSKNIVHTINGNRRLNAAGAIAAADSELMRKVSAPVISVRELDLGKEITITTSTVDATIYYTDNGGTPTDEDYLYEGPFVIYEDTSISAIGMKDGYNDSDVTYLDVEVIEPVVASPRIALVRNAAGLWITLNSTTEGATIYYSINNDILFNPIEYKGPFLVDDSVTVQAYAVKEHMADSGIAEETFNFVKKPVIAVEPVFGGQKVEITSETRNAIIYYTTDGTTPTAESDIYREPLLITADTTIKALATRFDIEAAAPVSADVTVGDTEAPEISCETGGGAWAARLVISSETEGAKIYYTTDGTTPTADSEIYTEPVAFSESAQVKVVASKDGCRASEVREYSLNITEKPTIKAVQTDSGVRVTLTCADENAQIYYTTDGTTPTAESALYTEPFLLDETAQVKAVAVSEGRINSASAAGTIEVSAAETPVISPADGEVSYGTIVNITTATEGAQIYYTTDGTDPTRDSEIYTEPIALTESGDVTVKAIAFKEGFKTSGTASASYSVLPPVVSTVKLNIGSVKTTGEAVSVPISMYSAGAEITSFTLEIEYDKTSLLCQNSEIPAGLSENDFSISETGGVLSIDYNGSSIADGKFITLIFAVQKGAADGDYDITVKNADTVRFNGSDEFEADVTNGKITVALPPPDTDILKTSVSLTNENGEDIYLLDSPRKIHVGLTFPQSSAQIPDEEAKDLESFVVVIAIYDENKTLAGLSVNALGKDDLTAVTESVINVKDGTRVGAAKLFIWKDFTELRPLREAKTLIGD